VVEQEPMPSEALGGEEFQGRTPGIRAERAQHGCVELRDTERLPNPPWKEPKVVSTHAEPRLSGHLEFREPLRRLLAEPAPSPASGLDSQGPNLWACPNIRCICSGL